MNIYVILMNRLKEVEKFEKMRKWLFEKANNKA